MTVILLELISDTQLKLIIEGTENSYYTFIITLFTIMAYFFFHFCECRQFYLFIFEIIYLSFLTKTEHFSVL